MIYTGKLAEVRVGHLYRVPTEDEMQVLRADESTRQGVVADAIADVLPGFLTATATGRSWKPDGGASISTYWTSRVVSAVYKHIGTLGNALHQELHEAVREDSFEYADPAAAPEDHATRLAQQAFLRKLIPPVKGTGREKNKARQMHAMISLYLAGYQRSEVAAKLRLKPARVDYLLKELRFFGERLIEMGIVDPTLIPGRASSDRTLLDRTTEMDYDPDFDLEFVFDPPITGAK